MSHREIESTPPPPGREVSSAIGREAARFYGRPLIDPSRILSPGISGRVFNPVVMAEFRRWKARPLTYIGIVLLVLFGISLPHLSDNFSPARLVTDLLARAFGVGTANVAGPIDPEAWINWRAFVDVLVRLLIRPSTILPLLMVWRALVSFRNGGLYRPFRTTFLTPGEFLWGIVAVPFAAAALILIFYTGYILGPNLVGNHLRVPPELRGTHPYLHLLMVLFEGAANGLLICFAALYLGLRMNARLSAMIPLFVLIVLIQVPHAFLFSSIPLSQYFGRIPDGWMNVAGGIAHAARHGYLPLSPAAVEWITHGPAPVIQVMTRFWTYFVAGIPKLVLAAFFWFLSTRHLRERDY